MKYLDNPVVPFGFILFYLFHPIILPEGGVHQVIAIAIFLLYAIVCALRLHRGGLCNKFIYYLDFFIVAQLLYFLFRYPELAAGNSRRLSFAVNQIESVLTVMMPIYTFYYYGIKGILTKKHIIWFSLIFLFLSIPMFYHSAKAMMEKYAWIEEFNETTNNKAYYFVQCCVFLPLIAEKRRLSIVFLIIIVFYLLLGVKRGAILCFVCMLPFYLRFFIKKTRFYVIPIIIIILIISVNFFIDFFSDMTYMQTRIEQTLEGDSSSRDVIYSKILDRMFGNDTSIIALLFGYGFNESVNIVGNLAHNDWLELLSGFGLFAIFIYIGLMINVFKILKATIESDVKVCLTIGLVIWIVQSFISMAYAFSNFLFILLGGLCGMSLYIQKSKLRNSLCKNI